MLFKNIEEKETIEINKFRNLHFDWRVQIKKNIQFKVEEFFGDILGEKSCYTEAFNYG